MTDAAVIDSTTTTRGLMRAFTCAVVAAALFVGSGCATATVVSGTLLYDEPGSTKPRELKIQTTEVFDTSSLAVVCGATAIFYGGACWLYLARPFEEHRRAVVEHTRDDVYRIGKCVALGATTVTNGDVEGPVGTRSMVVKREDGTALSILEAQQLCEPKPAAAVASPPSS